MASSTSSAKHSAEHSTRSSTDQSPGSSTDHSACPSAEHSTTRPQLGARFRPFAGDILAVLGFALLARIAHNTPDMPLSVLGWLETSWPFVCGTILGWGLLLALGALDQATTLRAGSLVWLCTAATGLILWGLRHAAVPHWSFIIVACTMSALLILGWRGIWNKFTSK